MKGPEVLVAFQSTWAEEEVILVAVIPVGALMQFCPTPLQE